MGINEPMLNKFLESHRADVLRSDSSTYLILLCNIQLKNCDQQRIAIAQNFAIEVLDSLRKI